MGVTFDATVTVGDVLTMIGGAYVLLGLLIFALGSKWFPSKKHVDETMAATRQDVQNVVGSLQLTVTQTSARLERAITECTSEARNANKEATEARHLADKAQLKAEQSEKTLDSAIARVERLVEGLLGRSRGGDSTRNNGG